MRRFPLVGLVLVLAACGGDEVAGPPPPTAAPEERYAVDATTVIQAPGRAPVLCLGGYESSLPPQCDGPEVVGWDWAEVDGEESASGATWGEYRVVGTWDGERLTVTEPAGPPRWGDPPDPPFVQACDSPTGEPGLGQLDSPGFGDLPDLVRSYSTHGPYVMNLLVRPGTAESVTAAARERWAGLLCVVERDEPTYAELQQAQSELGALRGGDGPLAEQLGSGIFALEPHVNVSVAVLTEEVQRYVDRRWGDLVHVTGILRPLT